MTTLISLDQFKLYVGDYDLDSDPPNPIPDTKGQNDPNIDLVDTVSEVESLTKVYDMDAGQDVSVLMDEGNSSGSGNDDYVVLVPVSNFAGLDPATTYVYLYVQMGAAGGDTDGDGAIGDTDDDQTWVVNGGFHEWNLQNALIIQGMKFNDVNGDGTQDAGEDGLAGVTVYIDDDLDGIVEATDNNGVLDVGEQFDITDADGLYSFGGIPIFDADYTIYIREEVPPGQVPTTTLPVAVLIDSAAGAGSIIGIEDVPGLLIGNHVLTPSVAIDKDADVEGDCADVVGELITYTITVDNDGELALTNVVLEDDFEGAGNVTLTVTGDTNLNTILDVGEVWLSGDTGDDGIMGVDETWTYTYVREVTQEIIDDNGVDGTLDNTATVNADSVSDSVSDFDDASVDVCQYPTLDIDKEADVEGDCADVVGELITYTVTLDNIGNVSLENVVLEDDFEGGGNVTLTVTGDTNLNTILDVGEVWLSGDTGDDGIMGVDETWTYSYVRAVTQEMIDDNGVDGTLDNTATANADAVTSGEAADEVSDDASVDVCQYPTLDIDKEADVEGDCADVVGELITYTVTLDNIGNVSLENVVLEDDFEGGGNVTLTVTGDTNLNTILDVGEVWLSGDTGDDGIMGVDETWTYSYVRAVTQEMIDDNGVDGTLDNTATANADAVTSGEAADEVSDDASVDVCQYPTLDIDKEADVEGDCADVVGELITYTVTLDNIGNVSLENVVLEDDFEGNGNVTLTVTGDTNLNTILDVGEVWLSGDTGDDGIMGVDETWTYTYVREVTQEDIDSDGYGNGTLDNVATANADAVTTGEAAEEVSDDASVDVCQYPAITLVKDVKTDQTAGAYLPADNPNGPLASTSSTVDFRVTVTNTGNTSLENVTLSDTVDHNAVETDEVIDYNAINAEIDIDNDGTIDGLWSDYDEDQDGTLDDADGNFLTVDDFVLAPGASFAVFYSLDSALGQHENTAVVTADAATTGTDVTAEDDANYYVVESEDCVGVRTPGFWANAKWGQFWNLNANNPGTTATDQNALPQAGQPGFASGELLYAIDTNEDGFVNAIAGDGINDGQALDTGASGLLIGDYNMNGVTDVGEDTIFISLADAKALINASNKNIGDGKTADGIWMLGRDVVATWLNYLANNEESEGNCIGDVGGATNTPREYLDASIDWLQQFASDQNSGNANTNLNTSFHDGNTQAKFQFDGRIAPSSGAWQNPFTVGDEDIPVSAAAMHAALDGYNNTGKINGIEYCCDADSEVALAVLAQINLV